MRVTGASSPRVLFRRGRAGRARWPILVVAATVMALLAGACSGGASSGHQAGPRHGCTQHATSPTSAATAPGAQLTGRAQACDSSAVPSYCARGGSLLWSNLVTCGWPGPGNTGPLLSRCPGGRLTPRGTSPLGTITISAPGTVIKCQAIQGRVFVQAANVRMQDSTIIGNSGKTGTAANGTADILVGYGASATIDHVTTNGDNGVHACVWDNGDSLTVTALNCFGADDGVFSWPGTSTSGNNVSISDSYFHNFSLLVSNGHADGYQTDGASNVSIRHNTYRMTTAATSAIAIWNPRRSASGFTVTGNLITGGGFSVYAEDLSPGDGSPGSASPVGGYSVTGVTFSDNRFSTYASGCVGLYGVWFTRPAWPPYYGGPTDGWHRTGNRVLETGENVDGGNPHKAGVLCR